MRFNLLVCVTVPCQTEIKCIIRWLSLYEFYTLVCSVLGVSRVRFCPALIALRFI